MTLFTVIAHTRSIRIMLLATLISLLVACNFNVGAVTALAVVDGVASLEPEATSNRSHAIGRTISGTIDKRAAPLQKAIEMPASGVKATIIYAAAEPKEPATDVSGAKESPEPVQPTELAKTSAPKANNENPVSESQRAAADKSDKQSKTSSVTVSADKINPADYTTLEWTNLIPEADLEALLNPPEYLNEIEDGSLADQVASQIKAAAQVDQNAPFEDNAYERALVSTQIIEKYNKQLVRVPGFIVPLEFDGSMTVTEFFLVPYFGACLHMPPPPPNQIIYVRYPQGLTLENLYDPFWIAGYLTTDMVENNTATSAYSLAMHFFEPYTDFVDLDESSDELDFEEFE